MKVGLIGAGNIGQHFATRILAAGHELVIFDLNKDVLSRVKSLGAEVSSLLPAWARAGADSVATWGAR